MIYRSRSALRSLYSELPVSDNAEPVSWFQFDGDVLKLMESLGFAVEHVAVSRRGDHGVDVFANEKALTLMQSIGSFSANAGSPTAKSTQTWCENLPAR